MLFRAAAIALLSACSPSNDSPCEWHNGTYAVVWAAPDSGTCPALPAQEVVTSERYTPIGCVDHSRDNDQQCTTQASGVCDYGGITGRIDWTPDGRNGSGHFTSPACAAGYDVTYTFEHF